MYAFQSFVDDHLIIQQSAFSTISDYGAHIYARFVPGSDVDVAALLDSTSHDKKSMIAEEQVVFLSQFN